MGCALEARLERASRSSCYPSGYGVLRPARIVAFGNDRVFTLPQLGAGVEGSGFVDVPQQPNSWAPLNLFSGWRLAGVQARVHADTDVIVLEHALPRAR